MNQHIEQIREQGWTDVAFAMSESDRAEYARLANAAISHAEDDSQIWEMLTFALNPEIEQGPVRTGAFGPGRARNSTDYKIYLHTGFQSRERADAHTPEWTQPLRLREFWVVNDELLRVVEESAIRTLGELGAESLQETLFPEDKGRRNVHVRTVRYTGATAVQPGTEVVSGHADLGLMTFHMYETHGGWFQATPYAPDLITAEDGPQRRAAVRDMRAHMQPIESRPGAATFFLGANWQTFLDVPEHLKDLPACYHAGIRPEVADEIVSQCAAGVAQGATDRVSVISFLHPNGDLLGKGAYVPATVEQCRPAYE